MSIQEKDLLEVEEIKEKIEKLKRSIQRSIFYTGTDNFCKNRVERVKILESYLESNQK